MTFHISRIYNGYFGSLKFFKGRTLDTKTDVANVHDMFTNVFRLYSADLRKSIDEEIHLGYLVCKGNPLHYTYLIIDGSKLSLVLDNYKEEDTLTKPIENKHFEDFKDGVDYAGKGINARKLSHLLEAKKILDSRITDLSNINEKYRKIIQIWAKGDGIVLLHLFTETNHFESMAREYAIIKALGIKNITNKINGCPYGSMKTKWNDIEIINYGNMILYNALKMVIQENPPLIYPQDLK